MKQNNRKNTWKAVVAVALVMASLFAMALFVNAGIIEVILGDEYITATSMSSSAIDDNEDDECEHNGDIISKSTGITAPCPKCEEPLMTYFKYCKDCGKYLGDSIDFHLWCN